MPASLPTTSSPAPVNVEVNLSLNQANASGNGRGAAPCTGIPCPPTASPCTVVAAPACPCPASKPVPPAGSVAEKALLKGIELADVHILERIRFREHRLYWLYVGSFAIIAGIMHLPKETQLHPRVYFGSMLAIQLLCIGIAWNYYANNIKITKLELLQDNSYDTLNISRPPKDKNNMWLYSAIYHLMEIAAFCIPSIVAYVCLNNMTILIPAQTEAPSIPDWVQILSLTLLTACCLLNFILAFFLDKIFGKRAQ